MCSLVYFPYKTSTPKPASPTISWQHPLPCFSQVFKSFYFLLCLILEFFFPGRQRNLISGLSCIISLTFTQKKKKISFWLKFLALQFLVSSLAMQSTQAVQIKWSWVPWRPSWTIVSSSRNLPRSVLNPVASGQCFFSYSLFRGCSRFFQNIVTIIVNTLKYTSQEI